MKKKKQGLSKSINKSDEGIKFGNEVFNIRVENKDIASRLSQIHDHYWATNKNKINNKGEDVTESNVWGLKYYFSLGNAVQNCPEFVVPLPALEQVANKYDLHLIHAKQLQQFVVDCCSSGNSQSSDNNNNNANNNNAEFVELLDVMSVLPNMKKDGNRKLTQDEWEAIGVYSVLVFQKN
jgi:hypothetical protein